MENEERNRIMDDILTQCSRFNYPEGEAFKECDKKARAWDELEKEMERQEKVCLSQTNITMFRNIRRYMAKFLSPTPKDPLEELEAWVITQQIGQAFFQNSQAAATMEHVLAKIRELKEKK